MINVFINIDILVSVICDFEGTVYHVGNAWELKGYAYKCDAAGHFEGSK